MIGDDLARTLPELRAQWLSAMRDTATVERLTPGEPGGWAPVWSGPCRLNRARPTAPSTPPGPLGFALAALDVQLPPEGTEGITVGDRVTIDAHGVRAYVYDTARKTDVAARRLACAQPVGGFTVTVYPRRTTDRLGDNTGRAPYAVPDCVIYAPSSTDAVDLSQLTTTALGILAPPGTPLRSGDELEGAPWLTGRYVIDGDPATGPTGVAARLTRAARRTA